VLELEPLDAPELDEPELSEDEELTDLFADVESPDDFVSLELPLLFPELLSELPSDLLSVLFPALSAGADLLPDFA
jgi:hypothetical protein